MTSAEGTQATPTQHAGSRSAPTPALRTAAQAEAMVVATVQGHADDLLRVARRYSLCSDDAYEAYQRALEIYVRHARRLEAASAHRWLFTVLKHEALAVRRQRGQLIGADEPELDRLEARTADSPEDRALAADDVTRHAAALRRLKPDEIRALWLKASGLSYAEIMAETGWSYTKVNRCLAEGRASLTRHVAAIESGAECEQYLPLLSRLLDGEASRRELRPLRAHLKACAGCRRELRSLHERGDTLGVVLPAGVLAGSAATDAATHVPNLLTRLYETVATTIHDRAAVSAIKLQAAVEAASTGKLAAVAASAAAVAGGGAVAATDVHDRPPSPARAQPARVPVAPAASSSVRPALTVNVPLTERAREPVRRGSASDGASRRRLGTSERPRAAEKEKPERPVAKRRVAGAASAEFAATPRAAVVPEVTTVEPAAPTPASPPASTSDVSAAGDEFSP